MNTNSNLKNRIEELKKEKNAVILAHNYQIPEIQDVADYVGDSLGLSQKAAETDAEIIVFCGVHFMAETASIISRKKKVLIPDMDAGCSLADTITLQQLKEWKKEHPGAVVVSYVNTSAEIKSETDYCVTSSNAVKVVESIPEDKEILFLPDLFLGSYVAKVTGRKIHIWPGECHVHAGIRSSDIEDMERKHPGADMMVHPECGCTTSFLYHAAKNGNGSGFRFLSTGGMIKHARNSPNSKFVVATENGLIYRLKKENPSKQFFPAREDAICKYMKMITAEKLLNSLVNEQYEVRVPDEIALKARKSIDRMLEISPG